MRVISAESTELFVGPPDAPLQLARVTVTGGTEPTLVRVDGDGLSGEALARIGRAVGKGVGQGIWQGIVEVPVIVDHPVIGQRRAARVHVDDAMTPFAFTVAEPGWTMFMISHFHYDPVWWNTQGAYTSVWREDPPGKCRQTNGFELVHA
ncbi:MAG: NEW3 domain-containing protein, partial [Mycobacterium sp.]